MVFSINTIKESLHNSFPRNKIDIEYFNEDISFFINSLEYMIRENREINIMLSQFHLSRDIIKVSNDSKNIIIKILTSFIETLDCIYDDFRITMMRLMDRDTPIELYRDKLSEVDSTFFYPEICYKYTNFGVNTSRISFKYQLSVEFSNMCSRLQNIKQSSTYDEISGILKDLIKEYDNIQLYLDDC